MTTCFCGNEITGQRRKFCSDECWAWYRTHNIASWKKPEALADDERDLALPMLPDDYVGAWLEPSDLRKRNKELLALGRRICRTHQGAALPLTEENFYYANRTHTRFETECKTCHLLRMSANWRTKVETDPDFLARRREQNLRSYRKHIIKARERKRLSLRVKRQSQRREKFARILGAVS